MTHSNQIVDDPGRPGFDWGHPFGSQAIGEEFAQTKGLSMLREAHAPLYRIHLLQRSNHETRYPEIETLAMADPLPEEIASQVQNGASWDLPILLYRRIVSDDRSAQPDLFDDQMRELHAEGYRTRSFEMWKRARDYAAPIAGRAFHVIFDDPSHALTTKVQSVLATMGFTATCILTVDPARGRLVHPTPGGQSESLEWRALRRLQAAGTKFGVRMLDETWRHGYSTLELLRNIRRARKIVSAELAEPALLFRAPDGICWTRRLQWIAGAGGFDFALCARSAVALRTDPLLAMPTIPVSLSCAPADLLARLRGRTGADIA